mmetsp:Transcript_47169/g.64232  ORF Transcript_47169/g.64232 Transcript_47169/m.64232 type:complete len:86 (+) Transcript_47169:30-287(+)
MFRKILGANNSALAIYSLFGSLPPCPCAGSLHRGKTTAARKLAAVARKTSGNKGSVARGASKDDDDDGDDDDDDTAADEAVADTE